MKKTFLLTCLGVILLAGCSKSITSEEAKNIALKDAGVSKNNVTFIEESNDDDSFEFKFKDDKNIYTYEIKDNGKINEKEVKKYYQDQSQTNNQTQGQTQEQTQSQNQTTNTYVVNTQDEALVKACTHFNVPKENVKVKEMKQEDKNGTRIYEIEFDFDGKEYSCEIDAKTGTIIDSDIDVM